MDKIIAVENSSKVQDKVLAIYSISNMIQRLTSEIRPLSDICARKPYCLETEPVFVSELRKFLQETGNLAWMLSAHCDDLLAVTASILENTASTPLPSDDGGQ